MTGMSEGQRIMTDAGFGVIYVHAKTPPAAAAAELLYPSYRLVSGLEWHGDGPTAEAAVAVAPAMIPRDTVSCDAHQILGCADLYAAKRGLRVVFLSDLTRMFTKAGTSWTQLGVDHENALRELHSGLFPAMFLTITERLYLTICDPAAAHSAATHPETRETPPSDRELARRAITRQLASDWPAYMQPLIENGRVSLTR